MSRPKIIRKVVKMGRDGRVKRVRDRREGFDMVRVRAAVSHTCRNYNCTLGRTIEIDTQYIEIMFHLRGGGVGRYPKSHKYHAECVPLDARPALRFFQIK